jgi:hypothetical protein
MNASSRPRFVWRKAEPWDLILAALKKPTLMSKEQLEEIRTGYEREWGCKLDKPRPFGMLVDSDTADTCVVYSRTANKNMKPNGLYDLEHLDHNSECQINSDGVVQLAKYVRIRRKYWDSPSKFKPALNDHSYELLCYCEAKNCKRQDKALIRAIRDLESLQVRSLD